MNPLSKLLYWDYAAIASQFAGDPESQSRMLTGIETARRLGFSPGMVSFCKRELVAFGLITILTEGKRDVIEIEDIWPRNITHFSGGTPDPMMDNPPARSSYETGRKRQPKAAQPEADVSPGETSEASIVHLVKHDVSPGETSATTATGSYIKKEVLSSTVIEEGEPENKTPVQPPLAPMVGNRVAAPNAPNPPRRTARKPNLTSAYPTTVEQEPRLADSRIVTFRDIFGREKNVLPIADIDEICERVRPDEVDAWKTACQFWSDKGYRIDGLDSVMNLVQCHIRRLRTKPNTVPSTGYSTGNLTGKPTIGQLKAIPTLTGEAKARALQEAEIKVAGMLAKRAAREAAAQPGGNP